MTPMLTRTASRVYATKEARRYGRRTTKRGTTIRNTSRSTLPQPKSYARRAAAGLAVATVAMAATMLPAILLFVLSRTAPAQVPMPAGFPRTWADAAAANEVRILDEEDRQPLRYRIHKVDNRGDVVREVIESREGNVARIIGRNAAPLSPEEDKAERDRLEGILSLPADFLSHEQRDRASHRFAVDLIKAMPVAMLWSYTPGQPQLPPAHTTRTASQIASQIASRTAPQIVIDFTPDPGYKPPTLVTEGLTGISGRVWIDVQSHIVLRIEGQILHPVNFGWGGMLARISEGGTLAFEQQDTGEGRWLYSRLSEHIILREVLVHVVHQNAEINVFDTQHLPTLPTYQDALRALLALSVPTH